MLFRDSKNVSFSFLHKLSCVTLLAGLGALFACGGEGEIGDACSTRGSVDECVEGGVCDQDTSGEPVCLVVCDAQDDCAEGYDCNGVSGSNIKACHPKE